MSTDSSSSSSTYEVILCTTPHHLREAASIRMDVFIAEQGFDVEDELDENDAICAHFLLIDTADPSKGLGTLRWVPYPTGSVLQSSREAIATRSVEEGLPLGRAQTTEELTRSFVSAGQAKLGRLAARKEVRGKKLGAKLVVDSEKWIRSILAANLSKGEQVEVGMKLHSQMQVVKVSERKGRQQIRFKLIPYPLGCSQFFSDQFYERLGYTASGEPFDEDGAPHMLCSKKVTIVGT
jgi:predicted GNAT family N-acyltransferase